jgi:hypothetical protein
MKSPVNVGDLVRLKEPDYCYGVGDLVLRVTAVPERLTEPDWIEIEGVQILWNGDRGNGRHVRARVSALRDPRSRERP